MAEPSAASEWPAPRHPGDMVQAPTGGTDKVLGTVLGRKTADGESFLVDQTMLSDAGIVPHEWVASMPLMAVAPTPEVNAYRVSEGLAAAFQTVMDTMAGGLAGQLVLDAQELSYKLYIVGGAVRDLVLGTPAQDVNDLDMTGDVPSGLLRDLVYWSGIRRLPNTRAQLRTAWLPRANLSSTSVVHGYRLIADPRPTQGNQVLVDHFLEYAPFKEAVLPDNPDGFLFGWDAEADHSWRDMTINSLLYDPSRRVIIDPGGVLDDLGVTQRTLRNWDGTSSDQSRMILRPIPIPASAPAHWAPKAVARLVKSIIKFPQASLSGITEWVDTHAQHLQELVPRKDDAAGKPSLEAHLVKAFDGAKPGSALFERVKSAIALLETAGMPAWFAATVHKAAAGSESPIFRSGSTSNRWPGNGLGAVRLEGSDHGFKIGTDLPSPMEADPSAGSSHFQTMVADWDFEEVEVDQLGTVVSFTDGETRIAATDAEGRVIPADR